MIPLQTPIRVGTKQIVLLEDFIDDVPPDAAGSIELCPANRYGKHAPIWMRESDLIEMRKRHPGVPVYGIWHLLLANKIVDGSKPSHEAMSGFRVDIELNGGSAFVILLSDGKSWSRSSLSLSESALFSIGVSQDALETLEVAISGIKLNAAAAELPMERAKAEASQSSRAKAIIGVIMLASLSSGYLLHLSLTGIQKGRQAKVEELTSQAAALNSEADSIRQQADTRAPEIKAQLSTAAARSTEVAFLAKNPAMPATPLNGTATLTLSGILGRVVSFPYRLGTDKTGAIRMEFSLDGSGDEAIRGGVK